MLFALVAHDKHGALGLRQANRQAHLDYIAETDIVVQAGPFLNEAGEMCGSMIILEVDSLNSAQDWAAGDPYAKAGLFDRVEILRWNKVIGV